VGDREMSEGGGIGFWDVENGLCLTGEENTFFAVLVTYKIYNEDAKIIQNINRKFALLQTRHGCFYNHCKSFQYGTFYT
jgi:hypothetical protein